MVGPFLYRNLLDNEFYNWRIAEYYKFVTWSGLYSSIDVILPFSDTIHRFSKSDKVSISRFGAISIILVGLVGFSNTPCFLSTILLSPQLCETI